MNQSTRSKHLNSIYRRNSWPQPRHIPLQFITEDEDDGNENGSSNPKRLSLSVRQPSFLFLSSDPSSQIKFITKDGNIPSNQNTIVFEPDFSKNSDQFSCLDTQMNLCNKSIYFDLSRPKSNDNFDFNDNSEIFSEPNCIPFFSKESFDDSFSDFDNEQELLCEDTKRASNIPRDRNSQIKLELKQINIERWNQIGYTPPKIDMK
ncbi:hypothetical protein M9Y10_035496 [Tritrichomonas musculus]|uniref:Uncharacterized protein n=1 Tax=Tritrichomonas musculus TaxID=1915356 RepID=A0ABR2KHX3_9EUKA